MHEREVRGGQSLVKSWSALGLDHFWNAIVPVVVGLVPCGVQAILFPETQYEYFASQV